MDQAKLEQKLQDLSIQLAATQLLLRSVVSCLLVEDDEESNRAIDKLTNSIERRAALGKSNALLHLSNADENTRQLILNLERSIRTEAIKMIADLRRHGSSAAS
jgi:GAF domain-containing protein